MPLFKFGGREDIAPARKPDVPNTAAAESVAVSKVLPRLLTSLSHLETPVLMDLGPVVGPNVAFFGEELACKFHVGDVFATIEKHARAGTREEAGAAIAAGLSRPPASVDAVLCWDVFDYLDRPGAKRVAATIIEMLKPGGLVYAFFGNAAGQATTYSRFIVESRTELRVRPVPATPTPRQVYVTRDIDKMFEGLTVLESVLLKSRSRETLFRKPV